METLKISLLGKLETQYQGYGLVGLEARKAQELLCYLLLYRDCPHPRESLANLLWNDALHSRTYLRKALWQLQTALSTCSELAEGFLLAKPEWIRLDSKAGLWLDVIVLEKAYDLVQGVAGQALDETHVRAVEAAVQLYKGNLLESWYQDWCLSERERLQQIYFTLLDKLVSYYEAHYQYEAALSYGERILLCDHARERTHQQLMRLYYLMGDRTGALRQYEHCLAVLKKEFAVGPSQSTLRIYHHIQVAQGLEVTADSVASSPEPSSNPEPIVHEALFRLDQLQATLSDMKMQLQRATQALTLTLNNQQQSSLKADGDTRGRLPRASLERSKER